MTTDIVKKQSEQIALLMSKNMKSLESVLPNHMDSKRFCRMAINCIMKNPELGKCDPQSFVMSVINCGEMGLEPSLGQAALVPYQGQVQAQPMYQGLVELARRSGEISSINAEVVYDTDDFEYEMGLEPKLKHIPNPDKQGEMKYAYAVAVLKDGTKQFVVLTKADIEKVKGSSKAAKSKHSPWNSWEPEMWKKTAIKRLCKMLPKSSELARAMTLDSLAEAGKRQAPAFADMIESTLNQANMAETPAEPPLKKPEPKQVPKEEVEVSEPKKKAPKKKEEPKTEEPQSEPDPAEAEPPEDLNLLGDDDLPM